MLWKALYKSPIIIIIIIIGNAAKEESRQDIRAAGKRRKTKGRGEGGVGEEGRGAEVHRKTKIAGEG